MLTIVQSKLCVEQFKGVMQESPFSGLDIKQPFRVVQFSNGFPLEVLLSTTADTIIYTNIWPITRFQKYWEEIETISKLKSNTIGLVATFDRKQNKIYYPRKNHVIYPTSSVAFFTLSAALLWNQTVQDCFRHSVSLAMFVALAYDIIFHKVLHLKDIKISSKQIGILQREYLEAQRQFKNLRIEIHHWAESYEQNVKAC